MEEIHILILRTFDELKFNLGKKTFLDFLKGNVNSTISNNNLDELKSYGILYQIEISEIERTIDSLILQSYIEIETIKQKIKVLKRTKKGIEEIVKKEFKQDKKIKKKENIFSKETIITKVDKELFSHFNFFLENFNDEQKKAIISLKNNILCVAGAGSGKTTVLTKRIEFLCKFRGIKQSNILAITFTRKAKEEMQLRLQNLGIKNVKIETFNSFCEKILKENGHLFYDKKFRMINFSEKIKLLRATLRNHNILTEKLFYDYFSKSKLRSKTQDELFFIFTSEIFSIVDFYKNQNVEIKEFYEFAKSYRQKRIAKTIYLICSYINTKLKELGFRDFSDQVPDVLKLYSQNTNIIPHFEYILVDEVQDLNTTQHKLLEMIDSKNNFYVGDPRQAIFSWRGSNVSYMLELPKKKKEMEIIQLKNNYRSTKSIVNLCNKSIEDLGFIDLNSGLEYEGEKPTLMEFKTEEKELNFIVSTIKEKKQVRRNEIFILARTNKILENAASHLKKEGIRYAIKSEEGYINQEPNEDEVILATIHSIKGMEARIVFLISANSVSFPNIVQDNEIVSLVKENYAYNKDEEELRLFYVALSRAKEELYITHSKQRTMFIKDSFLELFEISKRKNQINYFENLTTPNNHLRQQLREWRLKKAQLKGIPVYMVISNGAIEDILLKMPQSKQDLDAVRGLGEFKIAQYGDELISIVCL